MGQSFEWLAAGRMSGTELMVVGFRPTVVGLRAHRSLDHYIPPPLATRLAEDPKGVK